VLCLSRFFVVFSDNCSILRVERLDMRINRACGCSFVA